jgi:retron-type reverse transcriptase
MKRVGHLFEKVVTFENLLKSAHLAGLGKRHKRPVARFLIDIEREVIQLQKELLEDTYRPLPYFQFTIFEPKERKICSSNFRDRVVHHAISSVINPYFEKRYIFDTYACRVGKGAHLALQKCQHLAKQNQFFLKADIAKYFESIDHQRLKDLLVKIFKDQKLLNLMNKIIDHGIPMAPVGKGLPIGNLTSQHFANIYLGELDHFVKEKIRPSGYLRYMDDFILFHDSKDFLQKALIEIKRFNTDNLFLSLKSKATKLAPISEGVPYLGCRIFPNLVRLQRKNLIRMRKKVAIKERLYLKGYLSEEDFIHSLNSITAHVKRVDSTALLRQEVLRSLKMA